MALSDIFIVLVHQNRLLLGNLSPVSGAGSNTQWHFMVNHYYRGTLTRHTEGYRFHSPKGDLDYLAPDIIEQFNNRKAARKR